MKFEGSCDLTLRHGQGDNTTGPVPSHMLKALITMITTTKITRRTVIFAAVDLMDPHSPFPDRGFKNTCGLDTIKRRLLWCR